MKKLEELRRRQAAASGKCALPRGGVRLAGGELEHRDDVALVVGERGAIELGQLVAELAGVAASGVNAREQQAIGMNRAFGGARLQRQAALRELERLVELALPQAIFAQVVGRDALEVRLPALARELDHEAQIGVRALDIAARRRDPRAIAVRRGEVEAI